jgi:hypothetical protein
LGKLLEDSGGRIFPSTVTILCLIIEKKGNFDSVINYIYHIKYLSYSFLFVDQQNKNQAKQLSFDIAYLSLMMGIK